MMEVTTYERESGRQIWSGELDILVMANRDGLTEEEVRLLEGMGPGEQVEVGNPGFRVVAAGRPALRVIQGGGT